MGFRLMVLVMVLILLAFVAPLFAHHTSAAYIDYSKTMAITGVITRITWSNPHVQIYINAKDKDGRVSTWVVGLAPPTALSRTGFDGNILNLSDPVTMEIWGPKDGEKHSDGSLPAEGRTLTLSDGRKFDVHDGWLRLK